jgi:hypothetical protein
MSVPTTCSGVYFGRRSHPRSRVVETKRREQISVQSAEMVESFEDNVGRPLGRRRICKHTEDCP